MTAALLLLVYQAAGMLAFLATSPWLAWRFLRHRREMTERLGRCAPTTRSPAGRPLWIHAASLGELEGLRALLAAPGGRPADPLLLTVLSVSARDRAADLERTGVRVRFAPLDLWFCLLPFLRRERPRGLLLVETELWPATLFLCRVQGVPVAVVNGRLSARKWGTTRFLRPLLVAELSRVATCAAQSEADAMRFRRLGLSRVTVAGNLKYRRADVREELSREGDGRFLFVAGSLRRGEEAVLDAVRGLDLTVVVAPRHRREHEHWMAALRRRNLVGLPRSRQPLAVPPKHQLRDAMPRGELRQATAQLLARGSGEQETVLLLDTHGELGSWYAVADAAFVGGTLAPFGGHNLFEPAREGVPVAFGPHTGGVRDLAEPLLRTGGGREVRTAEELAGWLRMLRSDALSRGAASQGARDAALEVTGAAERTRDLLSGLDWIKLRLPDPSDESDLVG